MADEGTTLRRSRSNKVIAGVVGGLAKYFGMDPTIARILFVVVSVISAAFPGILVYVVLWVVLPQESEIPSGMYDGIDRQV